MNLLLLFDDDFVDAHRVRLTGRRREHVMHVHRAGVGDALVVGRAGGRVGEGTIVRLDDDALELDVVLDREPPPALPLTLVLALPRPKVLNRVLAGATSMGVKRIVLVNAWRVEKSYWKSPRMSVENLLLQRVLGLEQARDTILPSIDVQRFFRPFVERELPELARGSLAVVAHPGARDECPRNVGQPVTLVIGPEGGFIDEEIASLEKAGFAPVSLGERVLRVETAVAALLGRLF
ncbi:MAG: 16S rRNA (uracil(1498)-N(3))-methyltransferase [Acidobacteria bacterium]|nr:16S rRNA (uracil(1498)-N(3))-methyltransferase [Acidobacteriota bacterium]MBV9479105.1 16S rRNA (uracil(1498)-N(3))-methyltransferase [Acidobacteriota bacterium]